MGHNSSGLLQLLGLIRCYDFQRLLCGYLGIQTATALFIIAINRKAHFSIIAFPLVEIALCIGVLYAAQTGRCLKLLVAYMVYALVYTIFLTRITKDLYGPQRPERKFGMELDKKDVWVDAAEWEKTGGDGDWRALASKGKSEVVLKGSFSFATLSPFSNSPVYAPICLHRAPLLLLCGDRLDDRVQCLQVTASLQPEGVEGSRGNNPGWPRQHWFNEHPF